VTGLYLYINIVKNREQVWTGSTPEVMTTDWNRSNTGLMAIEASRQLKCITGLDMVGVRSSNGSIISTNPAQAPQLQHKFQAHIKPSFIYG